VNSPGKPADGEHLSGQTLVITQRPTGRAPSPLSGKKLKQRLDVLNSQGQLLARPSGWRQRTATTWGDCLRRWLSTGLRTMPATWAGRQAETPPECLIDYFPDDWLLVVDKATSPRVSSCNAMYKTATRHARRWADRPRLPRLPSADRQPAAQAEEFSGKSPPDESSLSATPRHWELEQSGWPGAPQVSRVDRACSIRFVRCAPVRAKVDRLLGEDSGSGPSARNVLLIHHPHRGWPRISADYLARGMGCESAICTPETTRSSD